MLRHTDAAGGSGLGGATALGARLVAREHEHFLLRLGDGAAGGRVAAGCGEERGHLTCAADEPDAVVLNRRTEVDAIDATHHAVHVADGSRVEALDARRSGNVSRQILQRHERNEDRYEHRRAADGENIERRFRHVLAKRRRHDERQRHSTKDLNEHGFRKHDGSTARTGVF